MNPRKEILRSLVAGYNNGRQWHFLTNRSRSNGNEAAPRQHLPSALELPLDVTDFSEPPAGNNSNGALGKPQEPREVEDVPHLC